MNGSEIAVLKFGFIICIILVIMKNVEKCVIVYLLQKKRVGGERNNLNCQGKLMNHKILMSHEILIVDWES